MNGASFAPNRMSIRLTVWPQLTLVTDLLTYLLACLLTYLHTVYDNNSRSFSLRNDLLKTPPPISMSFGMSNDMFPTKRYNVQGTNYVYSQFVQHINRPYRRIISIKCACVDIRGAP
jgi:hypothetical protein